MKKKCHPAYRVYQALVLCLIPFMSLVINYVFSGSAFAFILFCSSLYVILSILYAQEEMIN